MKYFCGDGAEEKEYDFVVIGAGIAGMSAAISAARHGVRTALIGDRPVLGGNASSEICIQINGACYNSKWSPSVYARETGIVEEIKNQLFQYAGSCPEKGAGHDAALFDMIYAEHNIDLYLNTVAEGVECGEDTIRSVECVQLASERRFVFRAPIYADCTGDGAVGALAGARYMQGTEGRDEYHESLAPPEPSRVTNGSSIMFHTVRMQTPQPYRRPDFAYDVTKLSFFKELGTKNRTFYRASDGLYHGFWWVEYGGHLDTIRDNEAITLELRKIVYGLWDYIKNSGKFPEAENMVLTRVCPLAGKRESRRFAGDYILNQNDVEQKIAFADAAYIGGWPMDVHADLGVYDKAPATYWNFVPGIYNIPYRTLYSQNVRNLFFAGRNTSCTRIANGSTRVMATCGAGGQAVGTAAYLCKKYDCSPRDVYRMHISELQTALLRDDQTIMGMKESYSAADVVCRATSVHKLENTASDCLLKLEKCTVLAIPTADRLDRLSVKVCNGSSASVSLRYKILQGDLPECYLAERALCEKAVNVEAKFDGWIEIPVNEQCGRDGKVYIEFLPNAALSLYAGGESLTGVPVFTCQEKEPELRDRRNFVFTRLYGGIAFKDVFPVQNIFGPENVLSGYNRPHKFPNLWISDGKGDQALSIEFGERFVEEIHLVFNTELEEDLIVAQSRKVIRDYDLMIEGKSGVRMYSIRGNYDRINRFRIDDTVRKIQVRPLENYGASNFEIFGVKIY